MPYGTLGERALRGGLLGGHDASARRRASRRWPRRSPCGRPTFAGASSTLSVPMTLIPASRTGSSSEGRTPACAARWKTTSGRCRSKSDSRPSARTSMLKNVYAFLPYPRASPRLAIRPVVSSSTATTRWSSARSRSARFEPMNPAPPVTRTVVIRPRVGSGRRRCPATSVLHERAWPRPAHATMAALSVHSASGGIRTRSPPRSPSVASRSRSRVLATTPPPSRTVDDPGPPRRLDRLAHLHVDDRLLEAGREVGQVEVATRRALGLHVAGAPPS